MTGQGSVLAKGASIQLAGTLVNAVITIASFAVLGRYLGPAGYGTFVVIRSVVLLFQTISEFSLSTVAFRDFSRNESAIKEKFTSYVALQLGMSVFASITCFVCVQSGVVEKLFDFVVDPEHEHLVTILTPSLILLGFAIVDTAFQAKHDFLTPMLIRTTSRLTYAISVGALVFFKMGLEAAVYAILLAELVGASLRIICTRKLFSFRYPVVVLDRWWKSTKSGAQMGLGHVIGTLIIPQLYVLFIRAHGTEHDVGLYAVAATIIIQSVGMLVGPISASNFPLLVKAYKSGPKELNENITRIIGVALVLGLLCSILSFCYADIAVVLLFGHEYSDSAVFVRGLAISTVFLFPNVFIAQFCIVANRELYPSITAVVQLVLLLSTGSWMLTHYGPIVVVYLMAVLGAISLTIDSLFLITRTSIRAPFRSLLAVISANLGSMWVLSRLPQTWSYVLAPVFCVAILWTMVRLDVLRRQDLWRLYQLIGRKFRLPKTG